MFFTEKWDRSFTVNFFLNTRVVLTQTQFSTRDFYLDALDSNKQWVNFSKVFFGGAEGRTIHSTLFSLLVLKFILSFSSDYKRIMKLMKSAPALQGSG